MRRRNWLKLSGVAFATTAAVPFLFQRRARSNAAGSALLRDPKRVLDLRPGLSYRILERAFDPMTDGYRVPARPDGMACFPGADGSWVLMRNHELDYNLALGPSRGPAIRPAYDSQSAGGVTRLVVSATTGERVSSNLVLAGTLRNCAGGPSPWGWISCEETTEPNHGYAFLCRADATEVQEPRRLPGYGRFRHEAAAVDPNTHIAYLTEDQPDSCIYRFVPSDKNRPFDGELQALRHKTRGNFLLSSEMKAGDRVEVDWVKVPHPNPDADTVRYQAAHAGAAILSRGEGICFANKSVLICSTDGGKARRGQIFALELGRNTGSDTLRLLAESPSEQTLDMPDNITLAPWGDVIVAEDGYGDQYIRGITPRGEIYDIARNAKSRGEFAGVCFSPDGSTLFANMQLDGLTVAITGTFPRRSPAKRNPS